MSIETIQWWLDSALCLFMTIWAQAAMGEIRRLNAVIKHYSQHREAPFPIPTVLTRPGGFWGFVSMCFWEPPPASKESKK